MNIREDMGFWFNLYLHAANIPRTGADRIVEFAAAKYFYEVDGTRYELYFSAVLHSTNPMVSMFATVVGVFMVSFEISSRAFHFHDLTIDNNGPITFTAGLTDSEVDHHLMILKLADR